MRIPTCRVSVGGALALAMLALGSGACDEDGSTEPVPDAGPPEDGDGGPDRTGDGGPEDDGGSEAAGTFMDRDEYGTPLIYAPRMEDAAYALGYAMAQDHGEAMVRQYVRASGRSMEFFGEQGDGERILGSHCRDGSGCWHPSGDANLYWDRRVHFLDIPGRTELLYDEMPEAVRAWVEAFTSGANRWLDEHRDDPRLAWVGDLVITPQMVVALDRLDLLSRQLTNALNEVSEYGATTCPEDIWQDPSASNGWAVSAPLVSGARAILAGDPHIYLDLDPLDNMDDGYFKYDVHFDVAGKRFGGQLAVGIPLMGSVYTDRLAVAGTASQPDISDAFHLVRVSGTTVRIGDAIEDLANRVRTKAVATLRSDGTHGSMNMTFVDSSLGPVVCYRGRAQVDCSADEDAQAFALVLPSLDHPGTFPGKYELLLAEGIPDAINGSPERGIVGLAGQGKERQNLIMADRDGRIMYHYAARVPLRRAADRCYALPLESTDTGALPQFDEDGRLIVAPLEDHPTIGSAFEGMPEFYTPIETGFVVNNNVPPQFSTAGIDATALPWHPGFFLPSLDRYESWRQHYARRRFDSMPPGTFTPEANRQLMTSVESPSWPWWRPALEQTLERHPEMRDDPVADAALDELVAWDGQVTKESRAPLLFRGWAGRLDLAAEPGRVAHLPPASGVEPEDVLLMDDQLEASRDALVGELPDGESGYCADGPTTGVITFFADAAPERYPDGLIPWGDVHRLRLPGEDGSGRPLDGGDAFLATLFLTNTPSSYECPGYGASIEPRENEAMRGSSYMHSVVFAPELDVWVSTPAGNLSDPSDRRYGLASDVFAARQFRHVVLDGPSESALRLR